MTVQVESFKLDHTTVKAPYVRLAERIKGPKEDVVVKYDLRLVQPNRDAIPTGGLHTLEHLFAVYFRQYLEDVIDVSPMGCRTGFYLIKFGETPVQELETVFIKVLNKVLETNPEGVPATTEKECGNYKDHSFFTAKEYARLALENFRSRTI
ncbi:S-ribosylhomocysteine lyase [Thermosediminibacter oceani]|uniref:S-ribosylhomocysteine lyase n=1 Tax=Thermosediminibacter oceani (strain ATCC BAA-1034 / DSM 16646 / JW/IW-1228P) TaxID=555079 RepID=D9RYS3_THEOJ|nr:S-ribosylhomocysteine lyase [Thermosediminibacter oceani]ADL08497.1 quorum-sensing autoinducer 2 (AI-2), LuxS [Thermosediminibacter oceani DSM 16646]